MYDVYDVQPQNHWKSRPTSTIDRLKKEVFTPKKNAFLLDQLCFHLKFFLHSCSSIQYYFFTVPFCFQYQRDQRMSHSKIKDKQSKYLRTVIAHLKLRNSRYSHSTITRPCYHVHPVIMKSWNSMNAPTDKSINIQKPLQ